ncbi:MAG: NAD-dependent epimerase/dehydratase family protein, partial [Betaproteobacteria bacterium]
MLITGATGFVGRATCEHLIAQGNTVTAAIRSPVELQVRTVA